jgi:hypothetical protein
MDVVLNAQADYFHSSLAELQTILDNESFLAIELESFPKWLREMLAGLRGEENTYKPPPGSQSIVRLAQKLIRD